MFERYYFYFVGISIGFAVGFFVGRLQNRNK